MNDEPSPPNAPLLSFEHYCSCGGFAWTLNGRNPLQPHMEWCPQYAEYAAWVGTLPPGHFDEKKHNK